MGVQGQLADSVTYLKISAKIIQFECNLYLSKEYMLTVTIPGVVWKSYFNCSRK